MKGRQFESHGEHNESVRKGREISKSNICWTDMHTYVYIYIYIDMNTYVYMYVCGYIYMFINIWREREFTGM